MNKIFLLALLASGLVHAESYQEQQHRLAVEQADKIIAQTMSQARATGNHSQGLLPSDLAGVSSGPAVSRSGVAVYHMPSGSFTVSRAGSQTFVSRASISR